jgi:hypothetical protein
MRLLIAMKPQSIVTGRMVVWYENLFIAFLNHFYLLD